MRQVGLRLLARREHSASELARKLESRGFAPDVVADAVRSLQADGWQDDARYAEQLSRSRLARGFGPLDIRHRLRQAGVDAPDAALLGVDADSWDRRMAEAYHKKFTGAPSDAREWARRARFLQGRGFATGQIRHFLDRLRHLPTQD